MISDWSGAALEYAFALKKPIIFCDVPRKINNLNYKDIDLAPIEVHIRDKLGVVWDKKKPIKEALQKCMNIKQENIDVRFDIGRPTSGANNDISGLGFGFISAELIQD